ncbi:bZIP family transcription factor [Coccidioides posadasii C735 delta SOWgp]|uniref:BZIP family transcription factor n=1 Tax=Coccidioides posadasii (strain C735) TaxID=222929 RepID=C5P5S0_COCP7|nr:bZIP family transcription factor [Coccidioides posadasii C735 delta SOWgp]EER28060.1 bZIP family transcription factor [Coccidioides posadasii C735 delta SOWgp]|eukprot:XP_003070205.1 bZIP family transcription factor [Coccidioides posadasii C735 delta SOWgp]
MSTSNLPLGMVSLSASAVRLVANQRPDIGTLLDLSTDQYVEDLGSSSHGSLLDQDQLDQLINFNSVVEQMPAQTVSPKDLMMDSSAPPSTSFTDMSTPSFESPGYFSHDTSPLIATDSDLGPGHEEWESLFPVESAMLPKFDEKVPLCSPKAPSALITPMTRTASSPGASPRNSRSSTRPSSISGVKPRNRDKPLPPIVYDTSDPVAAKRARNTEAARKSRARKVELQEQMERRIAELEKALEDSRQREAYWKSLAETQQ